MDAPEIRLRESPRLEMEGRARLFLGAADPGIEARLLDLSTTGMGLASPAAPTPGQVVAFELAIDGAAVEGRAVVVWSRRARPDRDDASNLGVRFGELDPASAVAIATVMKRLSADVRRPPALPSAAQPSVSTALASAAALTAAVAAADSAAIHSPAAAMTSPATAAAPPRPPSALGLRLAWIAAVAAAATVLAVLVYRSLVEGAASPPPAGGGTAPEPPAGAVVENQPPEASRSGADGTDLAAEAVAVPLSAALGVDTGGGSAPVALESAGDSGTAPLPEPVSEPIAATAPPAAGVTLADREPAVPPASRAPAAPRQEAGSEDAAATPTRARRLLAIEPGRDGGGEVLVLRADGPFRRQDVFAALIELDPPRCLLRLSGIERPWRTPNLEVASPLIERVRTGLHSTPRGPELHVVLDLPSRAIEHEWEIEGDLLRVRLRPRTP